MITSLKSFSNIKLYFFAFPSYFPLKRIHVNICLNFINRNYSGNKRQPHKYGQKIIFMKNTCTYIYEKEIKKNKKK